MKIHMKRIVLFLFADTLCGLESVNKYELMLGEKLLVNSVLKKD
jgi:hypothetical protein